MTERSLLLPASVVDESRLTVGRLLGNGYEAFDQRNPGLVPHLVGVAALTTDVLRSQGFPDEIVHAGQEMAAGHDIGKDGLRATLGDVWTEERRIRFRKQHTERGLDWACANTDKLQYPLMVGFACLRHHTQLPEWYAETSADTERLWGLMHVLQVADRTEALITRDYVQKRHGKLSATAIVDKVFEPYPYALPQVASIEGRRIDLPNALYPIVARTLATQA